jgi:hypothetical protein
MTIGRTKLGSEAGHDPHLIDAHRRPLGPQYKIKAKHRLVERVVPESQITVFDPLHGVSDQKLS